MDQKKADVAAVVVLVEVRESSCHYRNVVYYCQNRMMVLALVDQNLLLVHICFLSHPAVPIYKFKNHEVGISGGLIW